MALPPIPAVTPLNLAAVNNGAALTENWGRATAYFQRYLQDMVRGITASITNLQDIITVIEAIIVELNSAIADLAAQQVQIDQTIADLASFTSYVDVNIRGYINNKLRGLACPSGEVTATTSGGGTPGYINISHGAGTSPSTGAVNVQMKGTSPYCVNIASYDSTTIAVYVWDPTTGLGISGVSVTLVWNMYFWASLPSVPSS